MFEKKSFSRRQQEVRGEIPTTFVYNIDEKFVNQFMIIWNDISFKCIDDVYRRICLEFGIRHQNKSEDLIIGLFYNEDTVANVRKFLNDERNEEKKLSLIEFAAYYNIQANKNFIKCINELFKYNRIGYKLCISKNKKDVYIIQIEDETFFSECTEKALSILSGKKYTDAMKHYIEAYKKLAASDHNSALSELSMSIESLLKTRFSELNIPYAKRKGLAHLLDIAQANIVCSGHNFQNFKNLIQEIGNARNKCAHGQPQGQAPQLDEIFVRFVINQAAANLLFLAEVEMLSNTLEPSK